MPIPLSNNSVLWEFDITLSTSAVLVLDSSTALRTPTQFMSGLRITNNDPSIPIYIGSNSNLTTTKFWKVLDPLTGNAGLDIEMGRGAAVQLYVLAGSGTPSCHCEIIQ